MKRKEAQQINPDGYRSHNLPDLPKCEQMKPLTLLIKPAAGLCNMDCRYCFYKEASRGRENKIMTDETADMLIRQICAYQPSALSVVFQGGEPTLAGLDFFRRFADKVRHHIGCPVHYALQTNGLLIDNAFAAFFRQNGFLIGVSIDGDCSTNDRYRLDKNGNGVLPQALNAVSLLKQHGVDCNILSVIDDKNAAEIETTWRFFRRQGFDYLQFIPYVDEVGGIALSAESYETFLKRSFDLWYDDLQRGRYVSVRHLDNYIRILQGASPENCAMCGVCGSYFVVEADGSVYPCDFYCKAEYRLGSVFDDAPFAPSEKQRAFLAQSHIIHTSCRSCRYYVLCRGGCRRDRTEDGTKNKYCSAYIHFFDYAADRLVLASKALSFR